MAKTRSRSYPLTAYRISDTPLPIVRGDQARRWMDETPDRFAYRCLPLLIANQAGWDLLCPTAFAVRWNGSAEKGGTKIKFDGEPTTSVASHFGSGVITFMPGYLFRTTKNHNLWVKGTPNLPKDGIVPLEGLVETDWAPFTFTMNWKITRPRKWIRFEEGEPICRIVPFPRNYLESQQPRIRSITEDRLTHRQYADWNEGRAGFIADLDAQEEEAVKEGWQRTYVHGKNMRGISFQDHQTKLRLRDFEALK